MPLGAAVDLYKAVAAWYNEKNIVMASMEEDNEKFIRKINKYGCGTSFDYVICGLCFAA